MESQSEGETLDDRDERLRRLGRTHDPDIKRSRRGHEYATFAPERTAISDMNIWDVNWRLIDALNGEAASLGSFFDYNAIVSTYDRRSEERQ